MKIMIFTEGTIIMHKHGKGKTRAEIVKQVEEKDNKKQIYDFASYVPIGKAVEKIKKWKKNGAEIIYLTSRRKSKEIEAVANVLKKYKFPKGELLFRKRLESYKKIAERVIPDVLIEDDCESIGGEKEMTITHIKPSIRAKIKSIPIKEFGGIDHLPDKID
jgi:hypothetical protein